MMAPQFLQVFFEIGLNRELVPIHPRRRSKEMRYFLARYPVVKDIPLAIWVSPPALDRPRLQIRPRPVDFLPKGTRPKDSMILIESGQSANPPCMNLLPFNIRCLDEMMNVAEKYWSFLSGNPSLAKEAISSQEQSYNLLKKAGDRRERAEEDAIRDLMVCYLYLESVTHGRSLDQFASVLKHSISTDISNGESLRKELQRLRLPGMREARRQLE